MLICVIVEGMSGQGRHLVTGDTDRWRATGALRPFEPVVRLGRRITRQRLRA